MKNIKQIVLVLAAAALLVACNNTKTSNEPASGTEAVAADWAEVVLNVNGMTCDGCENAIKAGVSSLEGIALVESSHEEGWTRVKYDQNLTSVKEIEGKIADTGYVVEGEKSSENL